MIMLCLTLGLATRRLSGSQQSAHAALQMERSHCHICHATPAAMPGDSIDSYLKYVSYKKSTLHGKHCHSISWRALSDRCSYPLQALCSAKEFPEAVLQALKGTALPKHSPAPPLREHFRVPGKLRQALCTRYNSLQQAAISAALAQNDAGFTLIQVICHHNTPAVVLRAKHVAALHAQPATCTLS